MQPISAPTATVVGSQAWVRVTAPWVLFQATGIRTVVNRSERNEIAPKYCPLSAVEVTVMVKVRVPPGLIEPELGDTVIFDPAGAVVLTRKGYARPDTFVAVRVTVMLPGIFGRLIDGRLRLIAVAGFAPSAPRLAPDSSNTMGASAASCRSTRPAPMPNGSAAVVRSSLRRLVTDVVISADLIAPGVQLGRRALSRMADPAMAGAAIEVPAMAWKYWPAGPPATTSGVGVFPARICTPGAERSGLRNCPPGPRLENAAMTSGVPLVAVPSVKLAVVPGCAARKARNSVPSASCTVGRKWLSDSTSDSGRLYRIIPVAPPWLTLLPFSTRPMSLPR